jgi:hypothetical protein
MLSSLDFGHTIKGMHPPKFWRFFNCRTKKTIFPQGVNIVHEGA